MKFILRERYIVLCGSFSFLDGFLLYLGFNRLCGRFFAVRRTGKHIEFARLISPHIFKTLYVQIIISAFGGSCFVNDLHHLYDFVKALLAFNLLLNIINLFPMLIKALISERQRRSFGNVIIKGANIGGNFAAFKFVKSRFFFFG